MLPCTACHHHQRQECTAIVVQNCGSHTTKLANTAETSRRLYQDNDNQFTYCERHLLIGAYQIGGSLAAVHVVYTGTQHFVFPATNRPFNRGQNASASAGAASAATAAAAAIVAQTAAAAPARSAPARSASPAMAANASAATTTVVACSSSSADSSASNRGKIASADAKTPSVEVVLRMRKRIAFKSC